MANMNCEPLKAPTGLALGESGPVEVLDFNSASDTLPGQFPTKNYSTPTRVEFRVIPIDTRVLLYGDGVVTDNDDTVLLHTGQYIHDGEFARFACALSEIVFNGYWGYQNDCLTLEQIQNYLRHGSIFNRESWAIFRDKTGKSEDTVLQDIVELARERFEGLSALTTDSYRETVRKTLNHDFTRFMKKVQIDDGLIGLFKEIKKFGVPIIGCSASGAEFGERALQSKGIRDIFDHFIWGAVKKTKAGEYSGADIGQACEQARVAPQGAIMFGDTMNDVGAAKLAGIPVTVIRLPSYESGDPSDDAHQMGLLHRSLANQVTSFNTFSNLQHPYGQTVLVVSDFAQVQFMGRLREDQNTATFNLIDNLQTK
jgi:phosphoglycolate phosphatase-like HAD superfamily hydrolase